MLVPELREQAKRYDKRETENWKNVKLGHV